MYRDSICTVPDTSKDYPLNELGRPVDEIVVDQFYSQDFNRAENGFSRSDISAFIHAESDDLRLQIAQRLNEVRAEYPDQNLSDEQLINLCVPRNVQSQHDFREWASKINDSGFAKAVDEFVKSRQSVSDPEPTSDPVKSVVADPE